MIPAYDTAALSTTGGARAVGFGVEGLSAGDRRRSLLRFAHRGERIPTAAGRGRGRLGQRARCRKRRSWSSRSRADVRENAWRERPQRRRRDVQRGDARAPRLRAGARTRPRARPRPDPGEQMDVGFEAGYVRLEPIRRRAPLARPRRGHVTPSCTEPLLIPSSFTVENYRGFLKSTRIELRPLTLIFGHNSSGKSALVRFLPLLAESLAERAAPIRLDGEIGRDCGWVDLTCRAAKRFDLVFDLEWLSGDGEAKARYKISGDPEGRFQDVTDVSTTDRGVTCALRSNGDGTYQQTPGDTSEKVIFSGLIPGQTSNGIHDALLQLETLPGEVQWISGLRQRPERRQSYGGAPPRTLRSDGSNAARFIAYANLLEEQHALRDQIATFFSELGQTLHVAPLSGGQFSLELAPRDAPHIRVNMLDTGEGYAQVLAVLVALARAKLGGPRIVALEQPELHLHTQAQLTLARHLCAFAAANGPRLLVETHSEVVLASTQLAIAKGELRPDQVRVYWVRAWPDGTSTAEAVDFTEDGRPVNPIIVGAFDEAVELGRALIRERRKGTSK